MAHSDEVNDTLRLFTTTMSNVAQDITTSSRDAGISVSNDITAALDGANARFNDTVITMRDAANTIRAELEDTREQMRRGVLELPDETSQNATAMRRVVSDQIAALRDLAAIVEKSGKMLDSATPALAASAAAQAPAVIKPEPRAAAPRQQYVATAPSPTPQRTVTRRPAAQPPQPQRQQPNFPPQTTAVRQPQTMAPNRSQQMAGNAQAAAPRQQAPSPSRQMSNEDGGWVSNLLRRASEDEPNNGVYSAPQRDTRKPHEVVDSLNSLSMDIANAIDHEAAVELWERYQRGETNVFTRRLYTLQGQQTFDEIRNKYGVDRDFSEAVNRYIDDFERLLGDAQRSDPTGETTKTYLAADTGKVYTMLAHASGRFEN